MAIVPLVYTYPEKLLSFHSTVLKNQLFKMFLTELR